MLAPKKYVVALLPNLAYSQNSENLRILLGFLFIKFSVLESVTTSIIWLPTVQLLLQALSYSRLDWQKVLYSECLSYEM